MNVVMQNIERHGTFMQRKQLRERLKKILPDKIFFRVNEEWEFIRARYYKRLARKSLPEALEKWYFYRKGKKLDLKNPQTFSEKIQWLKIYDATPQKTILSDKLLVRDWIKEKIGEEYLIPLLGVWNRAEDINFDSLPEQFVLKTNHSSGWNIIVTDKKRLNRKKTIRRLNRWLKTDFSYYMGFEMQYQNIDRKIVAEKYMGDGQPLDDYKVVCFHGVPYYIWIDTGRYSVHRRNVYNFKWELQPFTMLCPHVEGDVDPPKNLAKMYEFSKILSAGFIHARVDFYELNGHLYFGEMTFTSGSGLSDFEPPEINLMWGKKMQLPKGQLFKEVSSK